LPSTRREFWAAKIGRNQEVDSSAIATLEAEGWRIGIVWECALKGKNRLPLEAVLTLCETWVRSDIPRLDVMGCTAAPHKSTRSLPEAKLS
jgi:DNA mismatch endonuclease (patch repair protein)